jgi:hypothetical protein
MNGRVDVSWIMAVAGLLASTLVVVAATLPW